MANKSSSDFDLRRKLAAGLMHSKSPPATPSSPKTPNSSSSCHEQPLFDAIGERPMVKRHKHLEQIGKTKSCSDIKHMERRLMRTYQEENIIKMPRWELWSLNSLRSQSDGGQLEGK
ncbi:unnamed protein product [Haemonchus placei]|uniref:Ovule protein n=1 Tax=Haemonchus placei TaxID=6290 RepID=A0A0N4WN24_HAEPC|nr:unnamed protein product [Haemonchus placei]